MSPLQEREGRQSQAVDLIHSTAKERLSFSKTTNTHAGFSFLCLSSYIKSSSVGWATAPWSIWTQMPFVIPKWLVFMMCFFFNACISLCASVWNWDKGQNQQKNKHIKYKTHQMSRYMRRGRTWERDQPRALRDECMSIMVLCVTDCRGGDCLYILQLNIPKMVVFGQVC